MSKAKTRVYVVLNKGTLQSRLVEGYSPAQVRSFVAQDTFHVEVASQKTLIDLLQAGKKVEMAAEPENVDAFPEGTARDELLERNQNGDTYKDPQ